MVPSIVVVDYHKGNLSSVVRGLSRAGARAQASDSPEDIRAADAVVLPGVGSFYDAIAFMQESGEAQVVLDAIDKGYAVFGHLPGAGSRFSSAAMEGVPEDAPAALAEDAMGSNLAPAEVFEASSKRWTRGLGVLSGSCWRFVESTRLKVPHVGWDQVHLTDNGRACELLRDFPEGANMYFTHSYAVDAGRTRLRRCGAYALHAQFPVRGGARQCVRLPIPSGKIVVPWARHPKELRRHSGC